MSSLCKSKKHSLPLNIWMTFARSQIFMWRSKVVPSPEVLWTKRRYSKFFREHTQLVLTKLTADWSDSNNRPTHVERKDIISVNSNGVATFEERTASYKLIDILTSWLTYHLCSVNFYVAPLYFFSWWKLTLSSLICWVASNASISTFQEIVFRDHCPCLCHSRQGQVQIMSTSVSCLSAMSITIFWRVFLLTLVLFLLWYDFYTR